METHVGDIVGSVVREVLVTFGLGVGAWCVCTVVVGLAVIMVASRVDGLLDRLGHNVPRSASGDRHTHHAPTPESLPAPSTPSTPPETPPPSRGPSSVPLLATWDQGRPTLAGLPPLPGLPVPGASSATPSPFVYVSPCAAIAAPAPTPYDSQTAPALPAVREGQTVQVAPVARGVAVLQAAPRTRLLPETPLFAAIFGDGGNATGGQGGPVDVAETGDTDAEDDPSQTRPGWPIARSPITVPLVSSAAADLPETGTETGRAFSGVAWTAKLTGVDVYPDRTAAGWARLVGRLVEVRKGTIRRAEEQKGGPLADEETPPLARVRLHPALAFRVARLVEALGYETRLVLTQTPGVAQLQAWSPPPPPPMTGTGEEEV